MLATFLKLKCLLLLYLLYHVSAFQQHYTSTSYPRGGGKYDIKDPLAGVASLKKKEPDAQISSVKQNMAPSISITTDHL